jgi:hypothetical protein
MQYICKVKWQDFPCKFFVYNFGYTSVAMTRFKRIDKYLDDVNRQIYFNFIDGGSIIIKNLVEEIKLI